MGTVHGLQIPHGVPVVFHKHHGVCTRQVQTQTPDMRGQQQHVDGGVVVKSEVQREKACETNWTLVEVQINFDQSTDLETMEWRRPACTLPSSLR